MSTPRLWSWHLSPFAGKARVAFAEKGVEVDLIEIDPRERPPRLRELNPGGRVPVLEVGDVAIRESTPICEWLEDTHPEPSFWPGDAAVRAQARGLLRWVDDELTLNFFLSMRKEAFGLDPSDHPDAVSILRDRLVRRWAKLEDLLSRTDGPWFMAGESPSLVDLAVIPLAVRLPAWKPELGPPPDLVRTAAWLEALRERPSAAEVDRRGTPVGDP
ncbi:MAG TPA: glutathione S-transferase family protein [Solirubrobacteraceae bacterium]|jgi:glutathione S-transferase|nr:glutathione S-transferase family protein [Solirubrobacteraceae bacterium]